MSEAGSPATNASIGSPTASTPIARTPELEGLIRNLRLIARNVAVAQAVVPPNFVEATPATPDQLVAAFAGHEEAQSYRVVLRGREPGLYLTVLAASEQIDGVPNQFQQRQTGLQAALAFYAANYPHDVKKLVEEGSVQATSAATPMFKDGAVLVDEDTSTF
ncbi:hypothetical protein C8F04DRAFT_1265332 [Mycena alexandri]|uniref:Uncharacterized protein n=1 Tax=Mycena alexandri TaxID=1745969 RepID=A0AAD6SLF7_9AGAR|nr:hypothetical protein C8F04DRAFT_1265332 [Mycena alexandri]